MQTGNLPQATDPHPDAHRAWPRRALAVLTAAPASWTVHALLAIVLPAVTVTAAAAAVSLVPLQDGALHSIVAASLALPAWAFPAWVIALNAWTTAASATDDRNPSPWCVLRRTAAHVRNGTIPNGLPFTAFLLVVVLALANLGVTRDTSATLASEGSVNLPQVLSSVVVFAMLLATFQLLDHMNGAPASIRRGSGRREHATLNLRGRGARMASRGARTQSFAFAGATIAVILAAIAVLGMGPALVAVVLPGVILPACLGEAAAADIWPGRIGDAVPASDVPGNDVTAT